MTTRMLFIYTVVLTLPLMTGCSDTEQRSPSLKVHSQPEVLWSVGFTLPDLLAEPRQVESLNEIHAMLSAPWYAAFTVAPAENPEHKIKLSSCTDYLNKRHQNLQPVASHETTAFLEVVTPCLAAEVILHARPAQTSYLPEPLLDNYLPARLPPEVATGLPSSESARLRNDKRIQSWADIHTITDATQHGPEQILFRHESATQEIAVVARGDFTGDGLEDLLISSRDTALEGSYTALRLFQLSVPSPGEPYRLMRTFAHGSATNFEQVSAR